jgi:hypothetical protein
MACRFDNDSRVQKGRGAKFVLIGAAGDLIGFRPLMEEPLLGTLLRSKSHDVNAHPDRNGDSVRSEIRYLSTEVTRAASSGCEIPLT